ncbi:TRAP transporter small permease subunit [Temperatibacter marinus]|uniref:TRAP transporter small permease protein n=1 Tax=Temperatibacter marinus TaxID=1456591 RepID=A0AA52H953_9PROT|nr:TRAP transporter small permease subunit [Temperatibacter marinus]WND02529.1 TRAP transporter small permease subunit [Temperatibacter marinus]
MLLKLAAFFEEISERTGQILVVTPLLMILLQFLIVVLAAFFQEGSIKLQESLFYINALMFLAGAGYTLKHNEHVRVDLFYSNFSEHTKKRVDLLGSLFLLIPFVALVWISGLPFVIDSWTIFEGSVESSGLPFVYLLKSTILLFALSLSLQVIANIITLVTDLKKN